MDRSRIINILRQCPDFGFVTPQTLEYLADGSRLINVKAGELIWRVGDPDKEVFVPPNGALIRVGRHHHDGTYINTGLIFQGYLFGEVGTFGGTGTRYNEAEALTACEIVQISGTRFLEFVSTTPMAKDYWLMASNVRRLMSIKQIYALSRRSALERMRGAVSLLLEFTPMPSAGRAKLPLTQEVLGRIVDLSRPTSNKVLRAWQRAGVIDIQVQEIFVIQPEYFQDR